MTNFVSLSTGIAGAASAVRLHLQPKKDPLGQIAVIAFNLLLPALTSRVREDDRAYRGAGAGAEPDPGEDSRHPTECGHRQV